MPSAFPRVRHGRSNFECVNLFRVQAALDLGRRHDLIRVGANDALDKFALGTVAEEDDFFGLGEGILVEAEICLACVLIRTVAGVAILGEDRMQTLESRRASLASVGLNPTS